MIRSLYLSYVTLNHPDRKVRLQDIDDTFLHHFFLRSISRLLLLCYAFLLFRPAVPYLKDKFAHTFRYTEHVRTVHVENGNEHVHYEIKKTLTDTEKSRSSQNVQKAEVSMDVCILPPANDISLLPGLIAAVSSDRTFLFILRYIEPDDHPPQQGSLTLFI